MESRKSEVCRFCGYVGVSQAQMEVHVSRWHEKELVEEGRKKGVRGPAYLTSRWLYKEWGQPRRAELKSEVE